MNRVSITLMLLVLSTGLLQAQTVEYKYQFMFLSNFGKFVEWPDQSTSPNFIIGVLDNRRITNEMETFFTGRLINGRKVQVKSMATEETFGECHILFVPVSNKNNLPQILSKVGTSHILIVTEREGWCKQGSDINFVVSEEGKLRFELNKEATTRHNLKIASALLSLAIVK